MRKILRMKRVLVLVILSAATLAAAEGSAEVSPVWKWANFAILAVGLGYLMAKHPARRSFLRAPRKSKRASPNRSK